MFFFVDDDEVIVEALWQARFLKYTQCFIWQHIYSGLVSSIELFQAYLLSVNHSALGKALNAHHKFRYHS